MDILIVRIGDIPTAAWRPRQHSTTSNASVGRGSTLCRKPESTGQRASTHVAAFLLERVRSLLELGHGMGSSERLDRIGEPVGNEVLQGEDLGFGGVELGIALCERGFESRDLGVALSERGGKNGDLGFQNAGLGFVVPGRSFGGAALETRKLGAAFGVDGALAHEAGAAVLEVGGAEAPEDAVGGQVSR